MEKGMNKILTFIVLAMFAFSMAVVSADDDPCALSVSLINQDPYPAVPGSYVKLVFQVSGIDDSSCTGAKVNIEPNYPFSFDDGENSVFVLDGATTYINDYETAWMIPVKLRVDEDAFDGNASVTVSYGETFTVVSQDFDVEIEDARTTFDAVIQDSTDEEVSIAIANTGKYTANSVVVRIPEQDGFTATSTDGQMVGNLDSGDYTIVTFEIAQTRSEDTGLDFDVYYTDSLGERRVVAMELSMGGGSSMGVAAMSFEDGEIPEDMAERMAARGMGPGQVQSNSSEWIKWTIVVLVGVGGLVGVGIFFEEEKEGSIDKEGSK